MSSSVTKPGLQSKAGQSGLPNNQAILLDKLNARRSTPDSEALASSDDEADPHRQDPLPVSQPQKPMRRSSWLNDTSQASRPRKGSFASSSMSPTGSHPSTPSGDTGMWSSHVAPPSALGRGHPASGSFAWGTGIWNNERKDAPSRLAEVLPSPTSTIPPGTSGGSFFGAENTPSQSSPGPREQGPTPQIPFAIPLHPTPKTYRSQSYSVGQLEPDAVPPSNVPSSLIGSRSRAIPHSGLQHRPSRPSMLSEMSSDGGMLGKVKEVEDDDDASTNGSSQGAQQQSAESKTIEMLARENAMLRQQQYQNARLRPRASSAAYGMGNGFGAYDTVPEELDYAVDERDEPNDGSEAAIKRALGRRMSEYGASGGPPFRTPYTVENRKLENVKKALWSSSLGFGGLQDISQSRRHSFADIPTRHGSISSVGETVAPPEENLQELHHPHDFTSAFSDGHTYPVASQSAYFNGGANLPGSHQTIVQSTYPNAFMSAYPMHQPFANRPPSPHRNMYGMAQPNRSTPLHIVLFKCARADVFYIQEGTGLTVKPGDLVIVEADRGTDLGTVAKDNVDWNTAKDLKEHYAEEHYKWLMMYSQNAAAAQDGTVAGLMAASNGLQGSAVGGMGPPSQHHIQEPNSGELKPKLIKRLAQSHEIHSLRDKEGNEAKAKRVCMQKVKEHGLNMEILDAEFQMDWKKLTFYYFADSYINFNSLVTDLFKIYKTRIWMSAINPASFASPTLGLQAPSGIGPGAVGVGRGLNHTERRQNQQQEQPQQSAYVTSGQSTKGPHNPFNQPGIDRTVAPGTAYGTSNYPMAGYGAFGNATRPGTLPYASGMMQTMDMYQGGFTPGNDFTSVRARFPSPQAGSGQGEHSASPLSAQGDFVHGFQGLSLNSR